jgi:hypothetical protein
MPSAVITNATKRLEASGSRHEIVKRRHVGYPHVACDGPYRAPRLARENGSPFARMTNVRQESVSCACGVYIYSVGGDASSRGRTLPTMVRHGAVVAPPILTCWPMASPFGRWVEAEETPP